MNSVHVQYFEETWCNHKNECETSCNVCDSSHEAKKNPIAKCCKVLACQLWKGLKQETLCDLVRVVLNCYLQEVRCNRCSCLHMSGGIHCSISNISVDQFSCSRQQHLDKLRPVFFIVPRTDPLMSTQFPIPTYQCSVQAIHKSSFTLINGHWLLLLEFLTSPVLVFFLLYLPETTYNIAKIKYIKW